MSYSQALPPTVYMAEDIYIDHMFNAFIDHSSLDELPTSSSGPCTPREVGYAYVPCFDPRCLNVLNHELERASALEVYTPSLSPIEGSCASWSSVEEDVKQHEDLVFNQASSTMLATEAVPAEEEMLQMPQEELSDLTDLSDLEEMEHPETLKRPRDDDEGESSRAEVPLMEMWKRQKMEVKEAIPTVKTENLETTLPGKPSKAGKAKSPVHKNGQAGRPNFRKDYLNSYAKLQAAFSPYAQSWSKTYLLNYAADTITSLREDAVRLEASVLQMKQERDQAIFLAERAEEQLKLFLKNETQ